MKITILNGNPDSGNRIFEDYLTSLSHLLTTQEHSATLFKLRNKIISYCVGCFNCWIKTPGKCSFPDDAPEILREVIHSDLLIFASPVIMGFTSALLKKIQDKLIPLVHPYIELVKKECHHKKRYEHYPKLSLLIQPSQDTDEEDIAIIYDIYKRLSINFRSELIFKKTTNSGVEEVVDAINRI